MSLPKDFGSKYIVDGAANNPEETQERARIVSIFILAHDSLSRMGYDPDISSLVAAYQGLSDDIRQFLDKGQGLPHLPGRKFAPVRDYVDSIMAFLGDARSFAIGKDERANHYSSEVYTLWQTYPLPAYMLVQYAQSFVAKN